MSNTFASLLRGSRLATYDRSINQVYTTPIKHKHIGDWGLKRNLPTIIRTNYTTIDSLDTAQHQTPWQSANAQVLFIKRWKENFPYSKKPMARPDTESTNIVQMTPADFNHFLSCCSKKQPEFSTLLKAKEIVADQVYEYLNVTWTTLASESSVVGPTYSDYSPQVPLDVVKGRILNASKNGHAVGIGGVVAFLPKKHSVGLKQLGDRRVRRFYVESAHLDQDGKPKVVLSSKPPGTNSSLPFMLAFKQDDKTEYMTTARMFLTRKSSIGRVAEDNNDVIANQAHDKLMSRISDLVNKN